MHKGMALLAAAAFLAMAVSGCSSSDKGGFSIKGPSATGEYTFTANGSADNYTWDLGDRLTTAYGKTVKHTYDFKNGEITVKLSAKKGDKADETSKPLKLGTGENGVPTFILEGQTNWTVVGESITFSAAKSTDPDGDPLRFSWSCVRTADAVRQPTHTHPGFGGVPFATPPAGQVSSQHLVGAVPAPDRKITGDLCQALGSGGRPSLDKVIEGSFTKTGIYDVYLLASDPVHPTTSGKYHFVVTTPEERPAALHTESLSGTFMGGVGGALSSVDTTTGNVWDHEIQSFSIPLTGLGGWVATTWNDPAVPGSPPNNLTWVMKRGTVVVATGGADGGNVTIPASETKPGGYSFDVSYTGPGMGYTLSVGIPLDRDPFKVY